jgi:hypothetical protein
VCRGDHQFQPGLENQPLSPSSTEARLHTCQRMLDHHSAHPFNKPRTGTIMSVRRSLQLHPRRCLLATDFANWLDRRDRGSSLRYPLRTSHAVLDCQIERQTFSRLFHPARSCQVFALLSNNGSISRTPGTNFVVIIDKGISTLISASLMIAVPPKRIQSSR